MPADPIKYPPSNFYTGFMPYQSNFWLSLTRPEFHLTEGDMASRTSFADGSNNDALIVYDARNNTSVARCVKLPTQKSVEEAANEVRMAANALPGEYRLFGISSHNPLDVYASCLSSRAADLASFSGPCLNPEQGIMPKPLHRVPTMRQQHYHQRHQAQTKHPQANNLKNKTRFSATGMSSNYMVVRDTKMSLSSAPSSPSAGSIGGSLGSNYLMTHPYTATSATHCVPHYKGSSSSSCCSTTGLKISSSSHSSHSSCSSMSSTTSMSGISPRKRRADDVINNNRLVSCRKEYTHRPCDGEIVTLCSCEACATEEVTARVDDVSLRDVATDEPGQQQKRSKNDDDVVFVSAEPASSTRSKQSSATKERQARKAKKSSRKAAYRNTAAEQAQSYSNFPFVVPTSCVTSESKDASGRYYLRSVARGRRQEEALTSATDQQRQNAEQSIVTQVVCRNDNEVNPRSERTAVVEKEPVSTPPRYHTRSRQKKANKADQKQNVQSEPTPNAETSSDRGDAKLVQAAPAPTTQLNYQPASVIQSAANSTTCKQQYVPTSIESSPPSEGAKETPRSSSSLKKLYDVHGIIGVGGGGTVYAGTRKSDGIQVAIKQVPKAKVKRWGKLNGRVVPIEFELLYRASRSGHTGVIGMLDWYERRTTYILVMERPQPVIDLFDYLNQYGALPEATARGIFRQIAEAVVHCHGNGVVHRDIKDENVLLNLHTSEAKLIDFGCGTVLKSEPYTEFAGTPEFYPPEWFTHRRYYGHRVDAWSLGVLLFTMVEAEVPFQKEKDIVECNLRHKRAAHLSDTCKHLIAWMLQKDQDRRPSIEQVLSHPWFHEGDAVLRMSSSPAVNAGVMGTDELYEKRIVAPLNGSDATSKSERNNHHDASTESPQSPPRYTVQETTLYQPQTTCQAAHQKGGIYQTECVAR